MKYDYLIDWWLIDVDICWWLMIDDQVGSDRWDLRELSIAFRHVGHRAILPANAAMGICPKHMEQLGTTGEHFRLWNLCVLMLFQPVDLTAGSYLAYSADKGQSIPQGFHTKVKHHRAMPNRWNGKYITTEFIRFILYIYIHWYI